MNHRAQIMASLAKYDEAERFRPITNGETLLFWEAQSKEAEEDLSELIDDIGSVDCARHVLFSPAL